MPRILLDALSEAVRTCPEKRDRDAWAKWRGSYLIRALRLAFQDKTARKLIESNLPEADKAADLVVEMLRADPTANARQYTITEERAAVLLWATWARVVPEPERLQGLHWPGGRGKEQPIFDLLLTLGDAAPHFQAEALSVHLRMALLWLHDRVAGLTGQDAAGSATKEQPFPWKRAILAFAILIILVLCAVIAAWLWGDGHNLLQKIGNCRWLLVFVFAVGSFVAFCILGREGWRKVRKIWNSWKGEAQ